MAPMKPGRISRVLLNMIFPVIKTKDNIIEFFNSEATLLNLWIQVARSSHRSNQFHKRD